MICCYRYDTKVRIKCYPFVTRAVFIFIMYCVAICCNSYAINASLVAI
nr:hypothetical protein AZFZUZMX_AZFZUZMX_CDS_0082 [Caudoviricetes sp.]